MPTPAELALSHTDLKPEELEHLQRLLGSWSVLADLSFSDLLLLVPVHVATLEGAGGADGAAVGGDRADDDPELVVLGQMRPNNRPTLVDQDLVGQTVNESQWTLVAQCLHSGEIVRGSIHHPILGEQVPVENIPVRFDGHIIGALLRVSLAPLKGPTSMYERTYLDVFERLADQVVLDHGGAVGRAHLPQDDQLGLPVVHRVVRAAVGPSVGPRVGSLVGTAEGMVHGGQQHQVGEGQVGQDAPRAEEALEVGQLPLVQIGPLEGQLGRGGHGQRSGTGAVGGGGAISASPVDGAISTAYDWRKR